MQLYPNLLLKQYKSVELQGDEGFFLNTYVSQMAELKTELDTLYNPANFARK